MPEGHTLHRLALDHQDRFAGRVTSVSSPQGRFGDAAGLDGALLEQVEAYGKHLLYRFAGERWVHVHLGLFGRVRTQRLPLASPGPSVRMRLANADWFADLVGPTRCAVVGSTERGLLLARLGPDPLRPDADPELAFARISRSRQAIAALLMDQSVLAGVGNVYRAEVLFRAGLDPWRPGRALTREEWEGVWADLRRLMRAGVRANRIVTTDPSHRERPRGRARGVDSFYVYRRHGEPCRLCGSAVARAEVAGRRLYWCPWCQKV